MTTFELTATVPATMNIQGEPVGSYTGRYRVSAPGADAAGYVAQQLFKADMARARLQGDGRGRGHDRRAHRRLTRRGQAAPGSASRRSARRTSASPVSPGRHTAVVTRTARAAPISP